MSVDYSVFITPLVSNTVYGTEIDISDRVEAVGIKPLLRGIDTGDYDVGVYTFADIDLTTLNRDGYFNNEFDCRSIFTYSRNLAKIRIVFSNEDGETTTFRGIVNEEATAQDLVSEVVVFKVLSQDSVLRTTFISSGSFSDGDTVTTALTAILDVPEITRVLSFNVANINPSLNFVIDSATSFTNKSVKDVLNDLLLASNSVLVVDSSSQIIVKSRAENETTEFVNLYGKNDEHGRENIVTIFDYNTGRHRTFTSFRVNDTVVTNSNLASEYGFIQKSLTLPYITTSLTERTIAQNLLTSFSSPRIELKLTIPTSLAKEIDLLDRISLNYPLRVKKTGSFLPIVGVSTVGSSLDPLPNTYGSLAIHPTTAFKVLEIEEDPGTFLTTLKLRQTDRHVFNYVGNSIVGFAVVGESLIAVGDDTDYNPSVVGAAQIGDTEVA